MMNGPDSPETIWDNPDAEKRQLQLLRWLNHPVVFSESFWKKGLQCEKEEFALTVLLSLFRETRPADGFPQVLPFLQHASPRVRANAAEALRSLRPQSASPFIYPLLEDPHNRVRGVAILALTLDPLFSPLSHIRALAQDPRERYRRTATHVLGKFPHPDLVSLLERLLDDPDDRIRDRSFEVLQFWVRAQIPEALPIQEKQHTRLAMRRHPDEFFRNRLDNLFSGLVHVVEVHGDTLPGTVEARWEAEAKAFGTACLNLGQKALESNRLPPEYQPEISFLGREKSRFARITPAQSLPSPDLPTTSTITDLAAAPPLDNDWEQHVHYVDQRWNQHLTDAGVALAGSRKQLDTATCHVLEAELRQVKHGGDWHIPGASTSILPPITGALSEIFDVTMRMYQKHVLAFSILSLLLGVGALLASGAGLGVVYAVAGSGIEEEGFSFRDLSGGQKASAGLWFFCIFFLVWGLTKTLFTLIIREIVEGRQPSYFQLIGKSLTYLPGIYTVQALKYFRLAGWLSVSAILGGLVIAISGDGSGTNFHQIALGRLAGLTLAGGVFLRAVCRYSLAESRYVLDDSGKILPANEALIWSSQVTQPYVGKFFLLGVFCVLLIQFISSSTQDLLLFTVLVPSAAWIARITAVLSQVCLFPLFVSNVVILALILQKREDSPASL